MIKKIFSRTQVTFSVRCTGYMFRVNKQIHRHVFYTRETARKCSEVST